MTKQDLNDVEQELSLRDHSELLANEAIWF